MLAETVDRVTIIPMLLLLPDWMVSNEDEREALVKDALDPLLSKAFPLQASPEYAEFLSEVQWAAEEEYAANGRVSNPHLGLYVALSILSLMRPGANGGSDAGISYPAVYAVLAHSLGRLGPEFIGACEHDLRSWFQGHDAELATMSSLAIMCALVQWATRTAQDVASNWKPEPVLELNKTFEQVALWRECMGTAAREALDLHDHLLGVSRSLGA